VVDVAATLRLDADAAGPPDDAPRGSEEDAAEIWEALSARGQRIVDQLVRAGVTDRRDTLRRALAKAIARIERRIEAVQGDLAKMQRTETAAERARMFVAEAARAPRGTTSLRAVDWTQVSPEGTPAVVEMALDPAKGPQEQLDALFRRARRMKDGARVAGDRLAEASSARDRLVDLRAYLADPATTPDFDTIESAARRAAPRDFKLGPSVSPAGSARGPANGGGRLPPHRTFLGHGDARVYVGRGAVQNDALTLRVARPHDLWLHAKGRTGAHVVVPLDKGASCPAEVLVDAAHLAAHFSDARGERIVEVQTTPRRYIRKPRGSAPGAVVVDREKVLVLRVDDDRLKQLLSSEVEA
jgi:predicted ribosome quality control (RQC) complex YloA/Tae2 family protein